MDDLRGPEGFFRREPALRAAAPVGSGRLDALLYPPLADIARRNHVAFTVLFALAAFLGSTFTFMLILLAGWALISLVLRRIPLVIGAPDMPVVLSCLGFVGLLSAIDFAQNGGSALYAAATLLLYILPAFQICRMRISDPDKVLPASFLGLAIGGVAIGLLSIGQHALGWQRVEGLMGNAGPLSVAALFAAGGAGLCLRAEGPRWRNLLALAGLCGALAGLLLSGMRGTWFAAPPVAAAVLWARWGDLSTLWRALSPRRRVGIGVLALLVALALVVLVLPSVSERARHFDSDLQALMAGNGDGPTSLSLRWEIYRAGLAAFADAPVVGYGFSRVWAAIVPYFDTATFASFSYSHLHNIVLTIAVAGGLCGVAALFALLFAPLATAILWRHRGSPSEARDRIAFAIVLVCAFLIPGFTNLSITHDVLDGIWILAAPTIAASVPLSRKRAW
ncbi:O-antigen ligase family protein [Antarcticirhabdus aurantiaca]|uniref:O-antigen ligase family protein n=1 Tax=Antarcticirhabdus aurantiaca TaxID=2606717 RepID=A0ACD4NS77_9HYPH|nr:O-antigen ligase family protein [Antarcticirhabdus aurantiaca]WAJ29649.1 O-antigen ligase family protein [Jeongeuplla avenae]